MEKLFTIMGAFVMLTGVGLGAFGAHGLSAYFEKYPELAGTFDTAVRYHLIHGLALLAIAWVSTQWPGTLTSWAGYLIFVGILIFSGSLYLLVITQKSWLGAITPIGGAAFLAGWLLVALAAWRG